MPDAGEAVLKDERKAAVGRLEPRRSEVVQRHDLQGQSLANAGEGMGISTEAARCIRQKALCDLRRDWRLRRALDEGTHFYQHKGVSAFDTDWTSVTEAAALWRIEQEQVASAQGCTDGRR